MKKIISIAVSVAILLILYAKIDFQGFLEVLKNGDRFGVTISLAMVFPIIMLTAWRLQQLMPKGTTLGFMEANRLILGACVLNMVLPSKMGDIAKSYFMKERGHLSGSVSLSLVVFEKASDMLSLLLWCAFGLIIYSKKDGLFWLMTVGVSLGFIIGLLLLYSRQFAEIFFIFVLKIAPDKLEEKLINMQTGWREMHDYFWSDKRQIVKIAGISIFIWFLHLLQIWLFIIALKASVPFLVSLAHTPLAILAGLMPLTFAGVGTRDAALIFFYRDYFNEATGAALGILCTSRYFIPAIVGLPFLGQMMGAVSKIRSSR